MEITDRDVMDARQILVFFWGREADSWNINKRVLDLLGEMLSKSEHCSKAMDLVPRPGFPVDASYIKRQLRDIARRITSGDHSYEICKIFLSANYKSVIRIAAETGL
jgi:hypothetical protein